MPRTSDERDPDAPQPEDRPGEVGAEGGTQTADKSKAPPMPDEEDDSPVGDTDQHSSG